MKKSFLLTHLALFSFGYGMVTFALPPFFTYLGADQLFLGEYGFLLMLPNVIFPSIFLRLNNIKTVSRLILISSIIVDFSIIMFLFGHTFTLFLILVLIMGIGQFIWWITTEIFFTQISEGTNLINIYSIIWGISYFISPLLAGYLIPYIGYLNIFIISFFIILFSIYSLIYSTRTEKSNIRGEIERVNGKRILVESFVPSFTSGLSIGILFSIFPGFALHNGIDVPELGLLTSVYALTRLAGFFYLIKITDLNRLKGLMNLSFLILLSIIVPWLTLNFYLLLLMMVLIGFSTALGISGPLIYISNYKEADIVKNISLYEFSFGISVSVFSLIFGYISQIMGPGLPYLIDFIITVFLGLIFYSFSKKKIKN